jgi:hypothetical protein
MRRLSFLLTLILLSAAPACFGQADQPDSSNAAVDTLQHDFGLFSSDEILNLSLTFDIREYMRSKPKEEYMKAVLTYNSGSKDSISKEVKIKSRGISRNSICNFPPISLNLKKAGFEKTEIGSIDKIKMVTHCNTGSEEYIFREFLVYKLFNVLTDLSFRVRLVRVSYINSEKTSKVIHSYAFLIEPFNMLTARTKSTEVENLKLSQKFIIPEIMDRISLFSYMIGNTDWSVPGQHNIKIVSFPRSDNPGLGGAVPFDFDYSGLVNAHYALPAEPLGLESVRERRYLGACRPESEIRKRLEQFIDKKQEFYRIINDFPLLNDKEKRKMTGYLDQFYSEIEKGSIYYSVSKECMAGL